MKLTLSRHASARSVPDIGVFGSSLTDGAAELTVDCPYCPDWYRDHQGRVSLDELNEQAYEHLKLRHG
jgi:hypothetical protein